MAYTHCGDIGFHPMGDLHYPDVIKAWDREVAYRCTVPFAERDLQTDAWCHELRTYAREHDIKVRIDPGLLGVIGRDSICGRREIKNVVAVSGADIVGIFRFFWTPGGYVNVLFSWVLNTACCDLLVEQWFDTVRRVDGFTDVVMAPGSTHSNVRELWRLHEWCQKCGTTKLQRQLVLMTEAHQAVVDRLEALEAKVERLLAKSDQAPV